MFDQNKYFIFKSFDTPSSARSLVTQDKLLDNQVSEKLASCETQLAQAKEQFIRVSADFENYKKRVAREQVQWFDQGQMRVLTQVLTIVDDFDRALAQQKMHPQDTKSWIEGFELIHKSLQKMLDSFEVKEIPANIPFDPEMHEAMVSVENSGIPSGDVVEILQKGYTYKGKVLRPAKVSVAK